MARTVDRLTPKSVSAKKAPGLYSDGNGLYLQVTPTGVKSWLFRYMLAGKARGMGLGATHTTSLKEAREAALQCRKQLKAGVDPLDQKHSAAKVKKAESAKDLTFAACAALYIDAHRSGWKNAKHIDQWKNTLATYADPVIGQSAVEGAGFSAANSVIDKGIDTTANAVTPGSAPNDKPWIDPKDMLASALAFPLLRAGHMVAGGGAPAAETPAAETLAAEAPAPETPAAPEASGITPPTTFGQRAVSRITPPTMFGRPAAGSDGPSSADKLLSIRPLDEVKATVDAAPDVDSAITAAQDVATDAPSLDTGITPEQQQRTQDIQQVQGSDALEQHLNDIHPGQAELVRGAMADSIDPTISPDIRQANNDALHDYLGREGVFDQHASDQAEQLTSAREAQDDAALQEAQAHPDVVDLNRALAAPSIDPLTGDRTLNREPVQVHLVDAPTDQHAIAQELGDAFGTPTFIVSANPVFNGVAHDGKVFISAAEQHPAIAVMGHEMLHNRPEVADQLQQFVSQYLRKDVVQQKQVDEIKAGGDGSKASALTETLADVNGAMWLQPEFWQQMRQKDPHLFRQAAYTFMEMATKAVEIAKGSKFDASRLVSDVDQVRSIISDTWAHHLNAKDGGQASPALLDRLAASRATEDTGHGIPASLFRTVKVDHDVWIADEGKTDRLQVSAKDALASFDEDIDSHESLLSCLKG